MARLIYNMTHAQAAALYEDEEQKVLLLKGPVDVLLLEYIREEESWELALRPFHETAEWLRSLAEVSSPGRLLTLRAGEDEPVCRAVIDNLYRTLARNHTPITDVTPLLEQGGKGAEIAAWLECHPCRGYAVLDDRDCFGSAPAVGEHWIQVPPERGLRYREYVAARRLLR